MIKERAYNQLRNANGAPNLLSMLDKQEHRRKRRIIGPVVSDQSMRVFEPETLKQVDAFSLQILRSSQRNAVVDMTPRCERLDIDLIGQLAFGYPLNTQGHPTHRVIVEGIKSRSNRTALYYL